MLSRSHSYIGWYYSHVRWQVIIIAHSLAQESHDSYSHALMGYWLFTIEQGGGYHCRSLIAVTASLAQKKASSGCYWLE